MLTMGALSGLEKEFEQYKRVRLANNAGIYDWADDNQMAIVQGYMRTRSRVIYHKLTKGRSRTLAVAPDKAAKLAQLSGGVQDWEYTGCVDTGYMGGGQCSLGHALRYEHYATSISTGAELIFGHTCASDFFSIPKDVLNRMKTTQSDLVEELKVIPFILETGRYDIWVENNYPDFADLVNKYGADEARKAFGTYIESMARFWLNGIPFTAYMIGIYNNARYNHYYRLDLEAKRLKQAKKAMQGNVEAAEQLSKLGEFSHIHYVKLVIALLADSENTAQLNMLDAEQRSKLLGYAVKLCELHAQVKEFAKQRNQNTSRDMDRLLIEYAKRCKEEIWIVATKDYKQPQYKPGEKAPRPKYGDEGTRLATKAEVASLSKRLIPSEKFPLGKGEFQAACLLAWAFSGSSYIYSKIEVYGRDASEELTKVVQSMGNFGNTIKWAVNGRYVELLENVEKLRPTEYLDSADDEGNVGSELRIPDIVEYLQEHENLSRGRDKKLVSVMKRGLDIAERWEKYGSDLTLSQISALRWAYDCAREATGDAMYDAAEESAEGEGEYYGGAMGITRNPLLRADEDKEEDEPISAGELVEMAKAVLDNERELSQWEKNKYKFDITVCVTVRRQGKCSEKQAKYVMEVYDFIYKKLKTKGTATGLVISRAERELRSREASKSSWGGYEDGTANVIDVESSADTTAADKPVDIEALKRKKGIPTIVEISEALGAGMFQSEDIEKNSDTQS